MNVIASGRRARHPRRSAWLLALLGSAFLAAAGAAPAPAAAAPPLQKGFWGPAEIDGVSQFPLYQQLGVTLYQKALRWSATAPTRPADPRDPADPAYRWPDDVDRIIADAQAHRISVLLMLIGTPRWANGGRQPEYAPDRAADFADFARAAARRYPAVRRWMIWGEPSRSQNFKPLVRQPLGTPITPAQARAPRRYARLLDAAYGELKAQRRSNLVIGGNTYTTGEIRPGDWVRSMRLGDGRPPRMDLYGHNPFSFRAPNLGNPPSASVDLSDLARFDRQIQRHLGRPRHRRIRLFLSEFTMPTAPDREFNLYVTPAVQARWITNAFRIARRVHADTLGWIHLRDGAPIPGERVIHGGLLTHDGRRKPGFYAFMRGGLTAAQRARESIR